MKPRSCDPNRAGCVPTFPELPPLHLFPLPFSGVLGAKLKPCPGWRARAPILRVLGFCSAARGTFASFPPSTPHFHFFPKTSPGIRRADAGCWGRVGGIRSSTLARCVIHSCTNCLWGLEISWRLKYCNSSSSRTYPHLASLSWLRKEYQLLNEVIAIYTTLSLCPHWTASGDSAASTLPPFPV